MGHVVWCSERKISKLWIFCENIFMTRYCICRPGSGPVSIDYHGHCRSLLMFFTYLGHHRIA